MLKMAKHGRKRKISDSQISRSLKKHGGKISLVADELGVATATIYARLRKNPRIENALNDSKESLVDKALDVLDEKMDEGNLKAAQYVLDSLGGKRGFGAKEKEKEDNNNNGGLILNILDTTDMDLNTKKLLMESLKKQQDRLIEEGEK